jgi:hypothetical protein
MTRKPGRWMAFGAIGTLGLGAAAFAAGPGAAGPDKDIATAIGQVSAANIQANIAALVGFGTRSTLSAQDPASIAAGRGIGAAREWIRHRLEKYAQDCGGCMEVRVDSYTQQPGERIDKPTVISNVYAVLKGTEADTAPRVVLVTGHYDSRNSDNFDITHDAPGANDDASGVAVSLECARVLSKLRFRATIIFLAVAGEEQGLYGSAAFARNAHAQNMNIEAVLNDDIVGGNRSAQQDAHTVRVFSEGLPSRIDDTRLRAIRTTGGENDSPSRELARYVAEVAGQYDGTVRPMLVFRADRFLRGGDHTSFNEQGYAAVRFTEYREDFTRQHQTVRTEDGVQYGDVLEHVDADYVAGVARLNAATLASLAAALTARLENDSTLEWDPASGASGYEVLWRATTSPVWEHAESVTSGTRVTLPISKDNVVFAVRSLDAQGHRSLPVVPEPAG